MRRGAIVSVLIGVAACAGAAEDPRYPLRYVDVIHESIFIATPAFRGLVHRLEWTEVTARVDDHWSIRYTNTDLRDRSFLDETFVQFENRENVVRAGRLRSNFGFGRWSDLFYNVVARFPIVRQAPFLDRYGLNAFHSAVEWHHYLGPATLSLMYGDAALNNRQFLPNGGNYLQGRLQTTIGPAVAGMNFANLESTRLTGGGRISGLDLKLTRDRISLTAEYVRSSGAAKTAEGYYADVTYRVPGLARIQVGGRIESYATSGSRANVVTAGARYAPSANLILNLNHGWDTIKGPSAPLGTYATSLGGWSFQTMLTYRFRT